MKDSNKLMEEAKANFLRPWDNRRGLETIDYNNAFLLVHAPFEEIGKALHPESGRWIQDILGLHFRLGKNGLFVFRLRGHSWAEILPQQHSVTPGLAASLSRRLTTKVIEYGISDTGGVIYYSLFQDGNLVEQFGADEDGNNGPAKDSTFSSKIRDVKLADIHNIWTFAELFFEQQEAYDPGITFDYFLNYHRPQPGQFEKVGNPGFDLHVGTTVVHSTPTIERVDYVELLHPK